ncbi:ABC-F family ATP-binding cassette domain-containing protein [Roseospira marina]|uniref:ABC-F family ATP-binding cassette domain-containing protein n=1 Tax=Roseospira marina TaxID=140057 RepID=A0A5M6I822_9PROT|nr:ABC-F family ATP-binding cassette domain-containing protein [Roseospira marina]KAA5603898.1 ABC-F family ATP-binding cassette domain-containing protein [Roseospira marina]MBB4315959.1 ATP-binding cassette subfamily F protein 3 [Roseospira marina]MBB5089171.1 ATP-binding cassette subfamily F protein 3 [Roseospira marina]
MLQINALTYRIGGRLLFDGASVALPAGARVGLVGRNGTGKSTLLRLILGEIAPDSGAIVVHPRARVGRLAQEAPDGPDSLIDCVLAADTERAALLAELEHTTDGHRIGAIHERLTAIEAHTAEARAARILSGLGFPADHHGRAVRDYSGGWRMRVALAAVLFARPDLLLLDEPTNHLDLEATLWLEGHLASYPGTVLIISHDRALLNRAVNRIWHLEGLKLTSYGGDYDTFEKTRREQMDLQARAYEKQQAQRQKIQAFVDRFRAKATKARQAQSRIKLLEKMEMVAPVIEDHAISFDFPSPRPLAPPLVSITNGVAGYGDTAVLRRLNLRLDMDDRVALLGANGNGKSTLAKVLAGRLDLMGGDMSASSKLSVGYFAQHQLEELVPGQTPLWHLRRLMPEANDTKVRAHLGRFDFTAQHVDTPVGNLSGGEKARLLIALMSREAPHLMILDEPTNHLDIDTREALVAALNAFEGAVVLITHDPHLVELAADRLWLVDCGTVAAFDGDMGDYRRLLLERAREDRREARAESEAAKGGTGGASARDRKDERRAAAELRQRTAPLRKAIQAAEQEIERLTAEKSRLEARLADPKLYDGPADRLTALQKELGTVGKTLEAAETRWMEAQEALEIAEAEAVAG